MEKQKLPVKECVLNRIKAEGVCPRPRLWFQTRECFVWLLWLVSVVLGALAVTVSLFVIVYNQTALFEATHDSWWFFMAEALPYLWLFILTLMLTLAVFDLRQSRRGYRHPLWKIVGSSVLGSFGLGIILHTVGTGYYVDHVLGQKWSFYMSQQKYEEERWQKPSEGRLVGAVVDYETLTGDIVRPRAVRFADVSGVTWETTVAEVSPADLKLLLSQERVHLFGLMDGVEPPLFYACGAIKSAAKAVMKHSEREHYLKEMKHHWREIHRELAEAEGLPRRCKDQALIRRLDNSFGF